MCHKNPPISIRKQESLESYLMRSQILPISSLHHSEFSLIPSFLSPYPYLSAAGLRLKPFSVPTPIYLNSEQKVWATLIFVSAWPKVQIMIFTASFALANRDRLHRVWLDRDRRCVRRSALRLERD